MADATSSSGTPAAVAQGTAPPPVAGSQAAAPAPQPIVIPAPIDVRPLLWVLIALAILIVIVLVVLCFCKFCGKGASSTADDGDKEIARISERTSGIQHTIELNNQRQDTQRIVSKLDECIAGIQKLAESGTARAATPKSAVSGTSQGTPTPEPITISPLPNDLDRKISVLQHSIDENTARTPQDLEEIRRKIDDLNALVAQKMAAMNFLPRDVSPQSSEPGKPVTKEPSKKIWGLINTNVERH